MCKDKEQTVEVPTTPPKPDPRTNFGESTSDINRPATPKPPED